MKEDRKCHVSLSTVYPRRMFISIFVFVHFFQNDPETLLRCLTMCAELLKQMNIKRPIDPIISALMSSLVKTACSLHTGSNLQVHQSYRLRYDSWLLRNFISPSFIVKYSQNMAEGTVKIQKYFLMDLQCFYLCKHLDKTRNFLHC